MNKKIRQTGVAAVMVMLLGLLMACGGASATTETAGPAAVAATEVIAPTAVVVAQPVATTAVAAAMEQPAAAEVASATAGTSSGDVAAVVTAAKLNLNTASGDDFLTAIPGFGSRMVREFQEYRPYVSILQFRREIGKYVDDATVAGYEQYVYVPVDANNADEATLMQLPGVDETVAAALVAGRPYADNAAFLAALAGQVPGIDTAAAGAYLTTP